MSTAASSPPELAQTLCKGLKTFDAGVDFRLE
jgi:hypothetical protein